MTNGRRGVIISEFARSGPLDERRIEELKNFEKSLDRRNELW